MGGVYLTVGKLKILDVEWGHDSKCLIASIMALWPDLWVDDKDKSSSASKDHFIVKGGVKEVNLAGEVPDLEADKGAAGDILSADLIGALQEQGLTGGHFMENHLLDGGLPTPPQAHQQYTRFDISIQRITEPQNCTAIKVHY